MMEKEIFAENFKEESKKYISDIVLFSLITIGNCIAFIFKLIDFRFFIITTIVMFLLTLLFVFIFLNEKKYELLEYTDFIKVTKLFRDIVIKKNSIKEYTFIKKKNIYFFIITTNTKEKYGIYTSYG